MLTLNLNIQPSEVEVEVVGKMLKDFDTKAVYLQSFLLQSFLFFYGI